MTRRRPARRRALTALFLLLAIAGGGLLALHRADPNLLVRRLAAGDEPGAPAQTPANAVNGGQPSAVQSDSPPPESRFAVIALRPLFSPGRRPADQPEAAAAPNGDAPPDLLVTGIVMAGPDSVAILESARPGPQAEPALVVRVGDKVADGWTVEAIEPRKVVLTREGVRVEMPLTEEDNPRRGVLRRNTAPVGSPPRQTPVQPQPRVPAPQQQPIQPQPPSPQPAQPPTK